ncbi:tRNA(Ile)-lysidine synthase [Streptohalobacillus salinus]|uniref:tRNA(Ile)-lysidine synthase n=1 Tax=Streptohalobacillus salinus TaxID=621096 RepID=A0A2V3W410_9BACI|nr:tRNA lysidine(34) synthetase TilS [Streptohalobacillus salinus]PXW88446.1 tRNA(Ile)-lysidine synthase [Streptohalobacillus salinus]
MLEKVKATITANQLLEQGDHVLVAVSGGADSMALLHCLEALQEQYQLNLTVCSIDHGLRGATSAADVLFVEAYAKQHALTFKAVTLDVYPYKKEQKISTQVAARTLRYKALAEVMEAVGATKVALAHHLDDQTETLLMRLVRQTEPEALLAMPIKRAFFGGELIRPFMDIEKEAIYTYLKAHQLSFREDASNQEDAYRRNALRLHVLPKLKAMNPNLNQTLTVLREHLGDDESYLAQQTEVLQKKVLSFNAAPFEISFEIEAVKNQPRALQRRLFHLILNYLYDTVPTDLSYKHEEQFYSLLHAQTAQQSFNLPEGGLMRKVYRGVTFTFKQVKDAFDVTLSVPGVTRLPGGDRVLCERVTQTTAASPWEVYLVDTGEPISVRTRQDGDRIYLASLEGHKKISRIFIDQKVDQELRKTWPILVQGEEILWVIGLAKSEAHKRMNTNQYVKITYQKNNL